MNFRKIHSPDGRRVEIRRPDRLVIGGLKVVDHPGVGAVQQRQRRKVGREDKLRP
jgi:hypothetical protein